MNYKKRRIKAGIPFHTMVKELGISEEKYREVEEKRRRLEGELFDKYLSIIKRGKVIKFTLDDEIKKIDEWVKSGEFMQTAQKYGYGSQKDLAEALNIAQSTISTLINKPNEVGNDLKIKIYNFLHDPLNKKAEEKIVKGDGKMDYIKWVDENLEKEIKKAKIKQGVVAEYAGCNNSHISHIVRKDTRPSLECAKAIYDFFNGGAKDKKNRNIIWVEKNLKQKMKENNITQTELAEKIGISRARMSRIIRKGVAVTEDVADSIYKYFNKQEEEEMDLFDMIEDKKEEIKEEIKEEPKQEVEKVVTNYNELNEYEKKLAQRDLEIIQLKRQIMMYEKLIARL